MTKSDASEASTLMAEAHASRGKEDDYSRVDQSVFNQAIEFIPDGAVWAVIVPKDGLPKLLAVDGQKLYTLTVGDLFPEALRVGTTCRLSVIDPLKSSVECETEFVGHRTSEEPMGRDTTWTFELGDGEELTIKTVYRTEHGRLSKQEVVAQHIAEAVGWTNLPEPSVATLS